MSSESSGKEALSEAVAAFLSSLNINSNEPSINEEKEATSDDIIDTNTFTMCANCGKEGDSDNMNSCNKCDLVAYCNVACKKKHKSKHKKKCERRAKELYDEKLFQEHLPGDECPICFLPLPFGDRVATFMACCGKRICSGCITAMDESNGADLCAFCRAPRYKPDEKRIEELKNLMDKGNAHAFYALAGLYATGSLGMPLDWAKANELCHRAGELGCAEAYFNMGISYDYGDGVEVDTNKAKHYYELAAMKGCVSARYNLGVIEVQADNFHRAYKHFILAARAGHNKALDMLHRHFPSPFVSLSVQPPFHLIRDSASYKMHTNLLLSSLL